MGKLRPTLITTNEPGLTYAATYMRVLDAMDTCRQLIHGKLRNTQGQTCAIGQYFRQSKIPIDSRAIDEIAAYNDSYPRLSPHER